MNSHRSLWVETPPLCAKINLHLSDYDGALVEQSAFPPRWVSLFFIFEYIVSFLEVYSNALNFNCESFFLNTPPARIVINYHEWNLFSCCVCKKVLFFMTLCV
jgi:hypothetical protein